MIIDSNSIQDNDVLDADICIMGAGVAGIVLASELADSGKKVIVLESGSEHYEVQSQELYKAESIPTYFPNPHHSRLRFLGGSSNHWQNSIERLSPIDFAERDWVKNSGWPIAYDEVARYYPKAEKYCGVEQGEYDFGFWQRKWNITDIFHQSKIFDSAVSKVPISPVRFYSKFGKRLNESKNITIVKNANVVDLEYDATLQKVNSVAIRNLQDASHTVRSKVFVMCFGGLENARMLLTFNEKYDDKLGNQSGNVGRYFMEHPTIRGAHFFPVNNEALDKIYMGIRDDAIVVRGRASLNEASQIKFRTNNMRLYFIKKSKIALSDGISSSHILADNLTNAEIPSEFGSHLLNIVKDIDLITEKVLKEKFDTTFFEDAYSFGGYEILSMTEQTPDKDNRIRLGEKRDQLGIKQIIVDFRVSDSDRQNAWKTLELMAKDPALHAIGRVQVLKEQDSRIWGGQLGFGQHHMGTTRMSKTPNDGVVDTSSRVFGTKNFFVAGSSVFPTGGHVPPTLTITALAIKLADHLRSKV